MTTNKNPELSGLVIPVIKIADEGNGDSLIITFLDPVGIGMIFPEDQGGKFLFGQIAGFFQLTSIPGVYSSGISRVLCPEYYFL